MYQLFKNWRLRIFITAILFLGCGKCIPFQDYPLKALLAQVETAKEEDSESIYLREESQNPLVTQENGGGEIDDSKKSNDPPERNYNLGDNMLFFGMALLFWLLSKFTAPYIEKERVTYFAGNVRKVEYNVKRGSKLISWIFRIVAWGYIFGGVFYFATDYKVFSGTVLLIFLIKKFLYKYKPKLAFLTILLILVASSAYFWIDYSSPSKIKEATSKQLSIKPTPKVGDAGKYRLTILAVHDKLSPVRVTVDEDIRRPYWVEHGEAIQFNWNKKITIEGNLPVTDLALNGFLYSLSNAQTKISLTSILADEFLNAAINK